MAKTPKKATPTKAVGKAKKTPVKTALKKAATAITKAVKRISPKKKEKIAEVTGSVAAAAVQNKTVKEAKTTVNYEEGEIPEPED